MERGRRLGQSTDIRTLDRHLWCPWTVLRDMEPTDGRIVVLGPDTVATGHVVQGSDDLHAKSGADLISGHDLLLFVAAGGGSYRANGRTGILRPNTLVAVPAGTFACNLSDDREMY